MNCLFEYDPLTQPRQCVVVLFAIRARVISREHRLTPIEGGHNGAEPKGMLTGAAATKGKILMDALTLLKADHAMVKALFREANGLSDRAHTARAKVFKEIARELKLHTRVEEQIFYPALKAKTKAATPERDEVLEAYEEHAGAKELIRKLEATDPKDETYKAKVQVLSEMVIHHADEEESEMFKQARKLMSKDELRDLGDEIAAMKDKSTAIG
jgi:hemerythrin superfamily protein